MIQSNEPITYPISGTRTFAEMQVVGLHFVRADPTGKIRLKAVLENFDSGTGDEDPGRHNFVVKVGDMKDLAGKAPLVLNLLKDLDSVVGLMYNVQFLQREIERVEAAGGDTTQLRLDLQAAKAALTADPE